MIKYSVVATVYNDEKKIEGLLRNIEEQTVKPIEVIIADGGSTDRTIEIIDSYCSTSKMNIRILKGGRLNIAQGLNLAIKNARSNYVGIVACGNMYDNSFFEALCNDLEKNDELDVAYGIMKGLEQTKFAAIYNQAFHENGYYLEIFPTNHGLLIRKSVFEEYGYFYEGFFYAGEDTEFFKRIENKIKWLGDEKAVIYWEIPDSFSDYYRQQNVYMIGDMQMYKNVVIIKTHWKRFAYVGAWLFLCFSILIPRVRLLFVIPMLYLLYRNISKILLPPKANIAFYNIDIFVKCWVILKNSKYLLHKNKMQNALLAKY